MGKSSGGAPQMMMMPSSQTTENKVPQWVQDAGRANYDAAANMNPDAFASWQGPRVAEYNNQQWEALAAMRDNLGSTNAGYQQALQNAQNAVNNANSGFGNAASIISGSINPQSVQNAMSGLQSSIGQAYSPLTNSVNYKSIDYSGNGFTPINYNNNSYQQLDVNKTPYSAIQAGANPINDSVGMINGLYDKNAGGVKSVAGAMDSIGAAYNPVTGNTNPAMDALKGTVADAKSMQGFQSDRVNAQTLPQGDISAYMNPYTENVINSSLRTLDKQRQGALNQSADAAIRSKAFGGSRQAIQDAALNSEYGDKAASLASNLYNQNFQQAQSALQSDQAKNLQAQLANQQAGIQGAGLQQSAAQLAMNSANTLGNMGLSAGNFGVNAANTLGNLGLNNANFGLNAANTIGNLGLQNRQQDIGAQQANANLALQNQGQINNAQQTNAQLALQNQGLGLNAQQANINAGLTQRGQNLDAQQSNMNAALQASQLEQQRQLSNANLGLQQQQQNQNAWQTIGGLGMQNANLGLNAGLGLGNLYNNQGSLGLQGAQLGGALTGARQDAYLSGANNALTAGNQIYNTQQSMNDANFQQYKDYQNSLLAPLNLRMQALGMTPYNTSATSNGFSTSTYQPTSSSPLSSALGMGLGGLSMLGMMSNPATALGGGVNFLGGLLRR